LQIKNSSNDNNETITKVKENSFITKPTFWCIEINAHALLYIILLVIKKKLPIDTLNTFMFNSQICEYTFRTARSLSGSFSSITTFSVKSFMKRCEKMSNINSIKTRGGQLGGYRFQFPHYHKSDKDTYDYSTDHIKQLNLTEKDIEKIMYNAFETAKKYVTMISTTQILKKKFIHYLN